MTSLENQYFMPILNDSWLSQAFTQDNNNTLTKPLQNTPFYNHIDDPFSPLSDMVRPESTSSTFTFPSISGSDFDTPLPKRINSVCNKKIMKRKSRASKKNTTTFINADASNFRQLVQQMTGVKFGVAQVVKPEAQRAGKWVQNQGCLPKLHTSWFLVDHPQGFTANTDPTGFNNKCFPILESQRM